MGKNNKSNKNATTTSSPSPSPTGSAASPVAYTSKLKRNLSENDAALLIQHAFKRRKGRKQLAKLCINRKRIVQEIISTEEGYVKDLELIIKAYQEPIVKQGLMQPKQVQSVFGNILMILNLNRALLKSLTDSHNSRETFYKALVQYICKKNGIEQKSDEDKKVEEKATKGGGGLKIPLSARKKSAKAQPAENLEPPKKPAKQPTFGECFKKITPFLKTYTVYINSFAQGAKTLKEARASKVELDQFLKKLKERPESRGLDLASFLILPIQRIPRYELLLKQLLKYTFETHFDYAALKTSLELIVGVNQHLNEQKRQKEALNKVLEIQKRILLLGKEEAEGTESPGAEEPMTARTNSENGIIGNLIQPYRHFVKEGKMKVQIMKSKEAPEGKVNVATLPDYECYLMTDLILLVEVLDAKKRQQQRAQKQKSYISLHLCFTKVTEISDEPKAFAIEYYVGGVQYRCFCLNETEAREWLETIEESKQEETTKLQKQVTEANDELDVEHLKIVVQTREDLTRTIPSKKDQFLQIRQKYNNEFKKKEDEIKHDYEDIQKKAEEIQIALKKKEAEKADLEEKMAECVERLRKGAMFLKEKNTDIQYSEKVLLQCLRGDKASFAEYFGDAQLSLLELKLDDLLHSLPPVRHQPTKSPRHIEQQAAVKPRRKSQHSTHASTPPNMENVEGIGAGVTPDTSLSQQITTLKAQLEDLNLELAARKKMFDNVCKDRNTLTKELRQKQEENDKLRHDIEELKRKREPSEKSVGTATTQHKKEEIPNEEKSKEVQQQLIERTKEVEILRAELENKKNDFDLQHEDWKKKLAAADEEIDRLNRQYAAMKKKRTKQAPEKQEKLVKQVQELKDQIVAYEKLFKEMKEHAQKAEAQAKEKDEIIKQLEKHSKENGEHVRRPLERVSAPIRSVPLKQSPAQASTPAPALSPATESNDDESAETPSENGKVAVPELRLDKSELDFRMKRMMFENSARSTHPPKPAPEATAPSKAPVEMSPALSEPPKKRRASVQNTSEKAEEVEIKRPLTDRKPSVMAAFLKEAQNDLKSEITHCKSQIEKILDLIQKADDLKVLKQEAKIFGKK